MCVVSTGVAGNCRGSPDEWEVALDRIDWGPEIGSGAFGSVYKCRLFDEDKAKTDTVAVKTCAGKKIVSYKSVDGRTCVSLLSN